MNQLWFWKSWRNDYQRLLLIFSLLFLLASSFLWVSYFLTPYPTIPTTHYQQLETEEIALHSFSIAGITLTTAGDNYILFENIAGGLLMPSTLVPLIYVSMLAVAMIILLSVITSLERFWYLLGMGLFILFIVGFRLESVYLFNQTNKIPTLVVIAVFGGLSYYFHYFNSAATFQQRILTFLFVTISFSILLYFFCKVSYPFARLAANGLVAGVLISIAFIFTVAHEIIAFFINVITQGVKQKNSLRHFLIIAAIYMVNLALTYAGRKGFLHWNFLSVNLFLLLTISSVLGLWGFRQRERLYANILHANPFGVYLFISLGVVCFATIAYLLGTANDPTTKLMEDIIMYSHLGYGVIFICYVIANFAPMLKKNIQVFKILYDPTHMPYATFRIAGLIATFTFFAYSVYMVSVHQLYSGYYNATADVYVLEGDEKTAESYYMQSLNFSNRNHHAHYALADMEAKRYQFQKQKNHYLAAAKTRPTELSYLNLSKAQERDGENLEANNTLSQGLRDFPGSGPLTNALGLSFAKLGLKDSAILTMEKAKTVYSVQPLAETNLVGLLAQFKISFPADSLMNLVKLSEKGTKTNALALANQQHIPIQIDLDLTTDSVLTIYEATHINNYIFNRIEKVDTALLKLIVSLARKPSNEYYKSSLLEAVSHSYYAQGEVQKAFKLLRENAFIDRSGRMYNTIGLWALEQGNDEIALDEFKRALEQKFDQANIGKALALSSLGNEAEAKASWEEMANSKDTLYQTIARSFVSIYSTDVKNINQLSNLQKYQFNYFRIATLDTIAFIKTINTITDNNVKAKAILDRSKKLWHADEPQAAANMLALLEGVSVSDKLLYLEIAKFNLMLLASLPDLSGLKQQMEKGLVVEGNQKINKVYYEALLANGPEKNEEMKKRYEWLANVNPFNEDVTISGIKYVKSTSTAKLKAFNLLVDAISLNPGSIKLMKAYIIEAANLGFTNEAQEYLDKLKPMISPSSFAFFIHENPKIFEVIPN